jgi:hypothetical protein
MSVSPNNMGSVAKSREPVYSAINLASCGFFVALSGLGNMALTYGSQMENHPKNRGKGALIMVRSQDGQTPVLLRK